MTINLGDKVKDSISGFSGIVTGRFLYLNGCVRINVDPDHLDKDGKSLDGHVFDENQLELMQAKVHEPFAAASAGPGGPRPDPAMRSVPQR